MDKNQLSDIKIAIAGRSKEKLEKVREQHMDQHKSKIGIIIASIENEESMINMCKTSKVVISTVGPYAK